LLLPFPDERNLLLKEVPNAVEIKYIYPQKLSHTKKIIDENLMAFFPVLYTKIRSLKLKKYDLLVSFKDSQYSVIFPASHRPTILWIHNLFTKRDFSIVSPKVFIPMKLLKLRFLRLCRAFRSYGQVVFVSHATQNSFAEIFHNGKPKNTNLRVIYNTIDFLKIKALSEEPFCKEITQHPVFAVAARFSAEKRLDRIVSAAKRLKDEGYKFKILVAGNGKLFDETKHQITELSLTDEVVLMGYTANPYPCIKACDWLICSSEKERFSLVVIESIYLGTPVITTDCGGPTEISNNGKYALLTENSSEGIYEGMKKVLDNPALAHNYTALADECLRRFDYDKWLEEVERLMFNG
jgi:glycosyltransferase involved in cell wall biosynthesis